MTSNHLGSKDNLVMTSGQDDILQRKNTNSVTWKLVFGPALFLKNPLYKVIWGNPQADF